MSGGKAPENRGVRWTHRYAATTRSGATPLMNVCHQPRSSKYRRMDNCPSPARSSPPAHRPGCRLPICDRGRERDCAFRRRTCGILRDRSGCILRSRYSNPDQPPGSWPWSSSSGRVPLCRGVPMPAMISGALAENQSFLLFANFAPAAYTVGHHGDKNRTAH